VQHQRNRLAADALKARLGDIARGRFRLPEARRAVLVREVIARYRTYAETHHRGYRSTRYVLAQLDAAFGTLPLTDLSGFRIEGWKAARRKVVAPATVNRELTVLKAMLAKAVAWHLLDVHPARDVRPFSVDNARVRWLPLHELARLLAAAARDVAAAWLVPAITIAVHTGLRQGELLRLRWTDLGPGRTIATIRGTKNNEPKHVPLNATVQAMLAALPVVGEIVLAWPWGRPGERHDALRRLRPGLPCRRHRRLPLARPAPHLRESFGDGRGGSPDGAGVARTQDAGDDTALQPRGPRAQGDGRRAAHRGPRARPDRRACRSRCRGTHAAAVRGRSGTFPERAERAADPGEAGIPAKSPPWTVEAGGIEPRTTGSSSRPRTEKTHTCLRGLSRERLPTPVIWAPAAQT